MAKNTFICENCGAEHEDTFELITLHGVNFCGDCAHQFYFIDDPFLGIIALPETNPDLF